jgi:hypothetical protein
MMRVIWEFGALYWMRTMPKPQSRMTGGICSVGTARQALAKAGPIEKQKSPLTIDIAVVTD